MGSVNYVFPKCWIYKTTLVRRPRTCPWRYQTPGLNSRVSTYHLLTSQTQKYPPETTREVYSSCCFEIWNICFGIFILKIIWGRWTHFDYIFVKLGWFNHQQVKTFFGVCLKVPQTTRAGGYHPEGVWLHRPLWGVGRASGFNGGKNPGNQTSPSQYP